MDLHTVAAVRRARSRADLAGLGPATSVLAGGTWLFSEPQIDVHELVDLTGMGWPDLQRSPDGLSIAATCTLASLVAADVPLARECCGALAASFKIWNTATVGGNICLALPAGSMTSLAVALDGVAVIWTGDGERRLPVVELVTGVRSTALAPGEVLRSVEIPAPALGARTAFRKVALSAEGRSGAVVIGRRDAGGEFVLAVTAATERPYRFGFATLPTEGELVAALDGIPRWYSDPHGAPDWRRHVTGLLAREIRAELA
jgi:CO/xanthine dehydrogenase FAD-binding subunit